MQLIEKKLEILGIEFQVVDCNFTGYADSQCIIPHSTDTFTVDEGISKFISEYSENTQNNLAIKFDSNIVLKGTIRWNSCGKLSFISKDNIIFTTSSYTETIGILELKSGIENPDGQGTVVFEGNGDEIFINATETGKVIIHYNPVKDENSHKYRNPTDYLSYIEPWRPRVLESYMLVNNAQDLQDIYYFLHMRYALSQDIDGSLKNDIFRPIIERSAGYVIPFSGSLEGNGYTISNIRLNFPFSNDVALFSRCDGNPIKNVKISNIIFDNIYIEGGGVRVAAVCGHAQFTEISNITIKNSKIAGKDSIGSVVGASVLSKFNNIFVDDTEIMSQGTSKGMIAGSAIKSELVNCQHNGDFDFPLIGQDLETNKIDEL